MSEIPVKVDEELAANAKYYREHPEEAVSEPTGTMNPAPMTPDEIRSKIVEQYNVFLPHMQAYHEYAERISALSLQYHNTRLSEVLELPMEEGVLVATLDARETPKSLDTKLAQLTALPDTKIRRVIFDRVKGTYYLFL